ncbi:hypothetical protein KC963_01285 [Candidatus Saccharibacteria bacterium]|nr:hypothetical protein [Candidatus Saccharibacteria bacterium]
MKMLRDFVCDDCGDLSERYVDASLRQIECQCGGAAKRIIGTPNIALDGASGDFPTAHDKWANMREQRHRLGAKKSYRKT